MTQKPEDSQHPTAQQPSWSPPSCEQLNEEFDGFEVIELIGRGGMGAVYKGWQSSLERFVAIKILPTELSQNEQFAGRFQREARSMARLSHPNIISVHDFGVSPGSFYYIVMEFVDGWDLDYLGSHARTVQDALTVAYHVTDALNYAHSYGIVHRDIKLGNIWLSLGNLIHLE